jgi:hypothetical protein
MSPSVTSARQLARLLGETTPIVIEQLERLLAEAGAEVLEAALQDALAVEAAGGEMLPDGSRRRTLGGIFFRLMRERLPPRAPAPEATAPPSEAPPPASPQPLAWEARGGLLAGLAEQVGRAASTLMLITGRPGPVHRAGRTVVFLLAGSTPPPLPRGLPAPPPERVTYACYLDARQWDRVEPALRADPADQLLLEGHAALDPETGTVAVFVQTAITRSQERARRQGAAGLGPGGPAQAPGGPAPAVAGRRKGSFRAEGPSEGSSPPQPSRPSVPTAAAAPLSAAQAGHPPPTPAAPASPPEPVARFRVGMFVRHEEFGVGDVIRSEWRASDEAVTVDFDRVGIRRIAHAAEALEILAERRPLA